MKLRKPSKNIFLSTLILLFSFSGFSQIPAGYYTTAVGSGFSLKTQLHNIINNNTVITYYDLWSSYKKTDLDVDGYIFDMYSENPLGTDPYNFNYSINQCGTYSVEGDCYNREHSMPKSWWGGSILEPMYTDIHHIVPTDGKVNYIRSNYVYGETDFPSITTANGSKLGSGKSGLGYIGTVFEPIDEFKGDFARNYFYMATRYEDVIATWPGSAMLNGTPDTVFSSWALNMLIDWHNNDPVSQKEINRNDSIFYGVQFNRNPFIDHPEYVEMIWGDCVANEPEVIGDERCDAGIVNLKATPSLGGTNCNWYTDASTGSAFYTGTTYAPTISTSTDYYVSTVNGSCESSRVLVQGKVDPTTPQCRGLVSIYDIQYTTDPSGDSPYNNSIVTTYGEVTAVRSDGRFYIQDSSKAWNGILIYENGFTVNVGDIVEVTGTVSEYFKLTEIKFVSDVTIVSSGSGTYSHTPISVSTQEANEEKYEGVLVYVNNAEAISNVDGFGQWWSNDGSDSLNIDDEILNPSTFNPVLNEKYNITGIMSYTFGSPRLLPINLSDIEVFTGVNLTASIPIQPTCAKEEFQVNISGTVSTNNKYKVWFYWDNTYATEIIIGEKSTFSENSLITCAIPEWASGGPYYLKVESTSPAAFSNELLVTKVSGTFFGAVDTIIGSDSICLGASNELFITNDLEATQFAWTFPNGTSILTEDDNDSIYVSFNESITDGIVYAQTVGSCGPGIVPITSVQFNSIINDTWSSFNTNEWGGVTTEKITGDLLRSTDTTGSFEGCAAFEPGIFTNKIAVIDRGTCNFSRKAYNAQQAGAVGVIIRVATDYPSYPFTGTMGGGDLSGFVRIPVTLLNDRGTAPNDSLLYYLGQGTVNVTLNPKGFNLNIISNDYANAGNSQTICEGETATLTASGGTSYSWNNGLGAGSTKTINPIDTTTYVVTVSNGTSCPSQDSVIINVKPSPTLTTIATPNSTICAGESTQISATGASSYTWSNGLGIGNNFNVSPSSLTKYFVEGTGSNGCKTKDSISITVNSLPIANAGNDQLICDNQSTTISASGGVSYSWNNGLGSGPNHIVSPTTLTSYIVTVNDVNNCSDKDTVIISLKTAPIANAGNDIVICNGANAVLTATGGDAYNWNNGLGAGQSHLVSPLSNTMYVVIVSNSNGCTDLDTVNVSINPNPAPVADAGKDTSICAGQSVNIQASGGDLYTWDNGLGTGSIKSVSPIATTTYAVVVTDNSTGCTDTDSVLISIKLSPTANAGNDIAICLGESTTLIASGGNSYLWDNGLGLGAVQNITPSSTTLYNVVAISSNGCEDDDDVLVTVNPLPSKPQITLFGSDLLSSASIGNQWLYNNVSLPNAINQSYTPSIDGYYSVRVTDGNGCSNTSDSIHFILNSIADNLLKNIIIYPNPNNGKFNLELNGYKLNNPIQIFNLLGEKIDEKSSSSDQIIFELELVKGIYFLKIDEKMIKFEVL